MADAPIEFRYYLRLFTLDDERAGIQPIRQLRGPEGAKRIELYAPPSLQWRARRAGGWTEWADVLYIHEEPDQTSKGA